eukprot:scaffold583_cov176-Amphora_coffeaeformis.AAC.5
MMIAFRVVIVSAWALQIAVAWTSTMPAPADIHPAELQKKYRERLKLAFPLQEGGPTAEKLCLLTEAHLREIPFDNLRVHGASASPMSLDPACTSEQLIDRHRGGVCFELNSLFGDLLENLGYHVSRFPATVLDANSRGDSVKEIPHMALAVSDKEGKTWIVDVGMGSTSPINPLAYTLDVEQNTPEGMRSRLIRDNDSVMMEVYNLPKKEWMPRLLFSASDTRQPLSLEQERELESSLYDTFEIGSDFRRMPVVCKLTRTEMVSLVGGELKVTRNRFGPDIESTTYDLKTLEEVRNVLSVEFGIPKEETGSLKVPGMNSPL